MEAGQGDARRRVSTESPYQKWQKTEEIPIYTGSYVPDLYHLELGPWERTGTKGAFINLAEQQDDDGWLIELPPSGQSAPQHHLFEALVYIVAGRGATTFWQPGSDRKQTVEWQRGSVFSPPLNCYYQHFNLDGQQPAITQTNVQQLSCQRWGGVERPQTLELPDHPAIAGRSRYSRPLISPT